MKKAVFALAMVLVIAAGANAQVPSPFSFYVGGAFSVPTSPEAFSDFYKTGYHFFGGAGYSFAPSFQVVGKIEYENFGYDWDQSNPAFTGLNEGGAQSLWMFGADGRYAFSLPASPVKPFVFAGAGMARISTQEFSGEDMALATSINSSLESQTELYYNVGAGVELKTGPAWSLFAQLRYVGVNTEGDASTFIPISVGLKFF